MNRNMDILFGVIAPTDSVFADAVETTSSTSIVSRAEVVADFTSAIGPQRLANRSDGGEEPPLPASEESAEACIAHAQE